MHPCIKGGIVGALILFLWGFVSWMILHWHDTTLHAFNNESAITEVIASNATQSGIYLLPLQAIKNNQDTTHQPFVFAAVHLEGTPTSMALPMAISFLLQFLAALTVAWMLMQTSGLSYAGRVVFVLLFALAASMVTHGPYWNWFYFDKQYTLVMVADLLIGWFLAALALARICTPR